jgi:hypothetical protein
VKVRFQADADLNEDIVTGVLRREPKVDFQTATAAGLRLLSDLEVLNLAAREGRILVSHDRRTMPRHSRDSLVQTRARAFSSCPKRQTCLLQSTSYSWCGRPPTLRIGPTNCSRFRSSCRGQFYSSGFVHRSPGNRAKSRSAVCSTPPYSIVRAAIAASLTRGPAARPSITIRRNNGQ